MLVSTSRRAIYRQESARLASDIRSFPSNNTGRSYTPYESLLVSCRRAIPCRRTTILLVFCSHRQAHRPTETTPAEEITPRRYDATLVFLNEHKNLILNSLCYYNGRLSPNPNTTFRVPHLVFLSCKGIADFILQQGLCRLNTSFYLPLD